MNHMLKCEKCNSYGFSEECSCGFKRISPKPAKFSPKDKYASYRRKYKEEIQEKNKKEKKY